MYIGEGGTLCTWHHPTPPRHRFGVFCVLVCSCNCYGSQKKVKAESHPARMLTPGLAGCHKNAIFGQFFMGSGPDLVEHRTR